MLATLRLESERRARDHPPALLEELFVIPLENDKYIIYAPLRRAAFVANSKTINFLADLQAGHLDEEADPNGHLATFLRQLEIVDGKFVPPPTSSFSGDPEPTSVTLFLTTACNLRCTYCYASAGDKPAKFMGLDIAECGIDFVAGNAHKKGLSSFQVNYHGGGEPTVHWRVMTESLNYARRKAKELNMTVQATTATNGVLTDLQIDWIVENLDRVSQAPPAGCFTLAVVSRLPNFPMPCE